MRPTTELDPSFCCVSHAGREEELQYLQRLTQSRPDILNSSWICIIFRWEQFEAGLENVEATERCGHFVEFDYLRSFAFMVCRAATWESLRIHWHKRFSLDTDKTKTHHSTETDPSFLLKKLSCGHECSMTATGFSKQESSVFILAVLSFRRVPSAVSETRVSLSFL